MQCGPIRWHIHLLCCLSYRDPWFTAQIFHQHSPLSANIHLLLLCSPHSRWPSTGKNLAFSWKLLTTSNTSLQTIGCLGALKLNERYLHIYLIVIFILLFGDGIIGVVWILRYNFIITNLKSELKNQISSEYQTNIQLQVRKPPVFCNVNHMRISVLRLCGMIFREEPNVAE